MEGSTIQWRRGHVRVIVVVIEDSAIRRHFVRTAQGPAAARPDAIPPRLSPVSEPRKTPAADPPAAARPAAPPICPSRAKARRRPATPPICPNSAKRRRARRAHAGSGPARPRQPFVRTAQNVAALLAADTPQAPPRPPAFCPNSARGLRLARSPARCEGPRPSDAPARKHPAAPRAGQGRGQHGQDQGEEPGRRTRRGRDDPHHLGVHQGKADPALPRHRPEILRPRHRVPRPDRRPGDGRRRQRHQAIRRRREVRDHHARTRRG